MTEIKLALDDPHSTIASLREGASDLAPFGQKQVYEVVRQIEEQVKPAIEEPTIWGSVVRARIVGFDSPVLLAYVPEPEAKRDNGYSWYSNQDSWHRWEDVTNPEVLRVGIGEAQ